VKTTTLGSIIVLSVALLFHIVGSILLGFSGSLSSFNITPLANSFRDLGLLAALLAGLVLVAMIIISAVKNAFDKKDGK